ncbi:unnamed protein product [Linum trigynum]|uniref:XS domain-containing protein n=2 Tax=Linum trigynum TaxID=586398 RepID=A0AAV2D4D3_9ROSI
MRDRRYEYTRARSRSPPPSPPPSRGSDRDFGENWRFPTTSCHAPPWPERDPPPRPHSGFAPRREIDYDSLRTRNRSRSRSRNRSRSRSTSRSPRRWAANREPQRIDGHYGRFSGWNPSADSGIGSSRRREYERLYPEDRFGREEKQSAPLIEAIPRREPDFSKFQRDNLFGVGDGNGNPSRPTIARPGPAVNREIPTNHFNRLSDSVSVAPTPGETHGRGRPITHYDYSGLPSARNVKNYGQLRDSGGYASPLGGSGSYADSVLNKSQGNGREALSNPAYFRQRRIVGADDEVEYDLDYRSTHLKYVREGHINGGDFESYQGIGNHGLERNVGSIPPGEDLHRVRSPYEGVYRSRGVHQPVYPQEELGVHDQLESLQGRRSVELEATQQDSGSLFSHNRNPLDEDDDLSIRDQVWDYNDIDDSLPLKDLELNYGRGSYGNQSLQKSLLSDHLEFRHGGRGSNGNNGFQEPLESRHFLPPRQRHSGKPVKASKGNIEKRLGPAHSVKQRLGPRLVPHAMVNQHTSLRATNVKERLGPALKLGKKSGEDRSAVKPLPWMKIREKGRQGPTEETLSNRSLEMKEKVMKTKPQENSEEFIQLINTAFLKFLKSLNESSAKRRKYTEQHGDGMLRCSVCGSDSKDFVDTLSLAQHASTSSKVGSRSEHLGFHKALCLMMGWKWNVDEVLKNGPWVRQKLPNAEALSLKEDLILWPPVVVIHNGSISNENPNRRIIVSIEELRSVLRGKGFSHSIVNICRGKAANQSIMVVSFAGTFSGLQEAEKLHRLYAENGHGRSGLQGKSTSTDSREGDSKEDEDTVLGDQVGSVEAALYGYLGIACDLDKLDFDMKKRCLVKSKKEINAIADAPDGG